MPAVAFLDAVSTKVRAEMQVVLEAVAEAPPPSDEATHHRPDAGAQELFEHYRRLRLANVAVLRGLDAASWQRTGRHPEWGPVTVLSQASYFARHQAAHQAQLAAAVEGRVPGEPRPVGA